MQIAVGIYSLHRISVTDCKTYLWLIPGLQQLSLIALFSLQGYPFNKMLRQHRVLHRANLYGYNAVFHAVYRYMLLPGSVRGSGDQLRHLLTAAHNRYAGFLDYCDDFPAMGTNVEFLFHHTAPLLTEPVAAAALGAAGVTVFSMLLMVMTAGNRRVINQGSL